MELKDLQSDLEALRELYGFLQCGGDVASSVVLGERSKLFLKNLLDDATKRVLETHKKIITAAECGVSGISCSSESEKCRALSKLQPCASPNMLKDRYFMKESDHHALCSLKDEDAPDKLTSHQLISQQSRLSFSLDKPENRKKRSDQFNKQSSMKQQSTAWILSKDSRQHGHQPSADERKLLERSENNTKVERSQSSMCGFQGTPSVVGSVVGSSRSLASGDNLANQDKKEGEAVNDFSKDVDNVVKHIESHISALRLFSKLANVTEGAVPHGWANMPTSECPVVNIKEHLVKKSELSQAFEPFLDRDELLLSGLESQRIGKKDDSNASQQVLGQSESDLLEDMTSQRKRIQHKEIGQTWKHIAKSNSRLNKKIGNWNVIGMVEAGGHKQSQTTACYVHGLRVPIKQDYITKRTPMPVKMPNAIPMNNEGKESTILTIAKLRPSIPSQSAGSKVSVRPVTDKKSLAHQILREQEKSRMGNLQNKILVHQQESEESTTAGTGSNDSEAYSLPSQDSAASITRRFGHGVHNESRSSTSSHYRDIGESGRLYPTRTDKPIRPANYEPEKAEGQRLGRLRRFKNKLGLIFHHHRHHHHHGYDQADCGDHSGGIHTKPTWMPLHNLLHYRNRHEVDEKLRKTRVSNEAVKHQVGHFHALVEGLMQHVRRPKKSKPSKGGMGWIGNEQHGHRNRKVKQLHWWQMFMRQGRVKLPTRRRVKIGFKSKRQQLKVPKLR